MLDSASTAGFVVPVPGTYVLTTTDAAIALQIAVGSRPSDPQWDFSGAGSVTSLDALMILQAAALPACRYGAHVWLCAGDREDL